jgi:hypothetical protein
VGHNPHKEENVSFGFVFQILVKLSVISVICPPLIGYSLGIELVSSRERAKGNQLTEKRGKKLNRLEPVTPIKTQPDVGIWCHFPFANQYIAGSVTIFVSGLRCCIVIRYIVACFIPVRCE